MLALLLTGDPASRFDNLLERFDKEWVPSRGYADRTLREIQFKLARYREDMGGLLVQIFAFAVAKGLCERNSAELTLVKKEAEKKRQRPTLDGLSTILNYSGTLPWLKRAIRLGLLSLQRREDIVTWPKTAVDLERNTLKVSPGRTQNYGTPIHLEIVMGQALREVVLV